MTPPKSNQVPTSSLAKLSLGQNSSVQDNGAEKITLLVDDTRFQIDQSLLTQHPNSLLGRMFGSGIEWQVPNDRGEYEGESLISNFILI